VLSLRRHLNHAIHGVWGWLQLHGAIAPGTELGDGFGTLGPGSCIAFPPQTLFNTSSMHIGEGTLIGRNSCLSVGYTPDDEQLPERGLVIGARCVIGARASITAHESIEIGHDVWFGQDVFVSDASHGYQDPETPIGEQYGLHQPVSIGSGSWIGHGAVILPGTAIGRNVVVGAGSVVRGTVPDHAVVAGVPARVVRRLEVGVGWVTPDGRGEVRPIWTAEDVAAVLAGA
jgi:acetyltransferase-like isoleucine patch superfamily enzyme